MQAHGRQAELRHGYQQAAALVHWSTHRPDDEGPVVFHAVVLRIHALWITHRPLDLAVRFGAVEWFWPSVDVPESVGDEIDIVLVGVPRVRQWNDR